MTLHRSRAIAVAAVVLILSVSGCASDPTEIGASTPTATATPTTTPTAAATPTPEPVPIVTSEIRLSAGGLSLVTDAGDELHTIGFFDDVAQTVTTLSEAIGADPVVTTTPGNYEVAAGVDYTWNGLVFQTFGDGVGSPPRFSRQSVSFTAATAGNVRLVGPMGAIVGSAMGDVPPDIDTATNGADYYMLDELEVGTSPALGYTSYFYLVAWASPDGQLLAELQAPVQTEGAYGFGPVTPQT